jgi:hypothetical protein
MTVPPVAARPTAPQNGRNHGHLSFAPAQASRRTMPTRVAGARTYVAAPVCVPVPGPRGPEPHAPGDPDLDVHVDRRDCAHQPGLIPFGGDDPGADHTGPANPAPSSGPTIGIGW